MSIGFNCVLFSNFSCGETMSGLESKASFKERALEIGATAAFVTTLETAGIDCFGKLAFVCSANPHSGDDTPLKTAVTALTGAEPSVAEMMVLRRLWFEANAYALADLKSLTDVSPGDAVKSMPLAERMARLQRQKDRLQGVIFDVHHEPSHHLVDRVQAMIDEGVLTYLEPGRCTSRSHEVQSDKEAMHIKFDGSGNLKVTKKDSELQCDTSGELQLRMALTRRSLAFDLAGLASFSVQELWHSHLVTALLKTPPAGHKFVTVQQVLTADKELWLQMSQVTRGKLKVTVGQDPPLDAEFKRLMYAAEIACYMTPLPAPKTAGPPAGGPPKAQPKPSPSRPTKRKFDNDKSNPKGESIKQMLNNLPKDCSSKLANGRFICLKFNKGTCPNQKQDKCKFGVHVCYRNNCGKNVPYIECNH